LEQDAQLALRGPQAFHITVVFQVAHGGQHLGVGETPAGFGGLQPAAEILGSDDGLAGRFFFFEAEDVVLDPLEGRGGDRRGLVVPRDQGLHALDELRDAFTREGARRDRTHDAVPLAERAQLLRRQRTDPAIRLRCHEDDGTSALPCLELLEPEAHAVQRVAEIRGVEQHQRQVRIVHEECVDQPVVGLAREVPEDRLAVRPVCAALAQVGKHPELLTVGRSLLLEGAVDQAIA